MARARRRGFGRCAPPDRDKDEMYLIRRVLARAGTELPTRKTWRINGTSLDQGTTQTCVGHAWRNFLRCAPIRTEKKGPSAFDIYRGAVAVDEWDDNDNEATLPDDDPRMASGTSVRAGAKVVMQKGRLKSYLWAFALQPAVEWVLTQGPVVLGTDWWSSFDQPDAEGIVQISPRARVVGGHAFLWRGVDTKRALALCTNSWGDDWGISGEFRIPFRDLERLIADDGEVCTAVEKRLNAKNAAPPRTRTHRAAAA
jgi:hypothetical protein